MGHRLGVQEGPRAPITILQYYNRGASRSVLPALIIGPGEGGRNEDSL